MLSEHNRPLKNLTIHIYGMKKCEKFVATPNSERLRVCIVENDFFSKNNKRHANSRHMHCI